MYDNEFENLFKIAKDNIIGISEKIEEQFNALLNLVASEADDKDLNLSWNNYVRLHIIFIRVIYHPFYGFSLTESQRQQLIEYCSGIKETYEKNKKLFEEIKRIAYEESTKLFPTLEIPPDLFEDEYLNLNNDDDSQMSPRC